MQETEFKSWLQAQQYAGNSIATWLSDARKVDRAYDLDAQIDFDGGQSLLSNLAYSKADEAAARPNPTKLDYIGPLYSNLAACRAAVRAYLRFRESQPSPQGRFADLELQSVLDAISACGEAGATEAYIATLEGLGQPSRYWLIFEGMRYPSKAIVRDALARSGSEWLPGGGECKTALEKLGFVVVDWPELQSARDRFLRQMPDFASFNATEGAYWNVERRYKNQLIKDARAIVTGDDDDRIAGESIYRKLVTGQQGVPLNHFTLIQMRDQPDEFQDRFYTALGELARSESPGGEAIAKAARELEALRDAGFAGLRRGEVLSIPITVWATLHPDEASWFKIAKIEEMGKRFFRRKLFPQNEFRKTDLSEWLQLMRALFGLLDKEFGWQPQDLFDVQGFIWVALGGDDRGNAASDEKPIWLVTSLLGDEDGTDRFIESGEWSLLIDTDSTNNRRVREMQVGDRIFLKDFIPRAKDLPFDVDGGVVTANRIRAAGTVTEPSTDGLRVGVDWERVDPPRIWYFYTNNDAVWRLKDPSKNHPTADRLRAFLIEGAEQDYTWFLNHPFWRDRLFGAPASNSEATMQPTNLILYGPPGTGKTYRTASEAVRLCDGDADYGDDETGRAALMARYAELVKKERIEFVTFHQNFSYEDFVEGLRPTQTDEDGNAISTGFRLAPEPGVFSRIAERAEVLPVEGTKKMVLAGRRFFKMSLGEVANSEDDYLYDEAIEGDFIHLGGDSGMDWSEARFTDKDAMIAGYVDRHPDEPAPGKLSGPIEFPHQMRNSMREGDIVVISKGNLAFRAIGEVTGPFHQVVRDDEYTMRRSVRWLWRDDHGLGYDIINTKRFSQRTVYEMAPSQLKLDAIASLLRGESESEGGTEATKPYVLVIDEINRANISKVFGELITLIEPDKRLGQPNALKVRLPYSKREFGVPSNLHIVGTMNTADRSIALLDTALRRRFRFEEIAPDTSVPAFRQAEADSGLPLARVLETMNQRIEYLVDRDHRIGHAFFIGCDTKAKVDAAMRDKVIPLLQEYFFDDWNRLAAVLGEKDKGGNFLACTEIADPMGEGPPIKSWRVRAPAEGFAEEAYHRLVRGTAASPQTLADDGERHSDEEPE